MAWSLNAAKNWATIKPTYVRDLRVCAGSKAMSTTKRRGRRAFHQLRVGRRGRRSVAVKDNIADRIEGRRDSRKGTKAQRNKKQRFCLYLGAFASLRGILVKLADP